MVEFDKVPPRGGGGGGRGGRPVCLCPGYGDCSCRCGENLG